MIDTSDLRRDVVAVLVRTDPGTVVSAIKAGDTGLIRLADGTPPTADELAAILSARMLEWDVARAVYRIDAALEGGDQ